MKMSVPQFKNLTTKQRSILALALTVLSCCAIGGVFFGDDPESAKPSKEMANDPIVQTYVKALETIEENYVNPPDKFRLTRGAILEMLHTLDPHSTFLSPEAYRDMNVTTSGAFGGLAHGASSFARRQATRWCGMIGSSSGSVAVQGGRAWPQRGAKRQPEAERPVPANSSGGSGAGATAGSGTGTAAISARV